MAWLGAVGDEGLRLHCLGLKYLSCSGVFRVYKGVYRVFRGVLGVNIVIQVYKGCIKGI